MAYRKMRATRNGIGSSSRLYKADDHLLSVESNIFTEKYYRFYFPEIQAIIVRRTDRGAIWSIVLALIALMMTTCSITAIPAGEWAPTPGYFTMALIAAGIMVVNMVKGPSCETHFQTSVTVQKVGALNRIKKTEAILPEIRSCIRAQQGSVTSEDIVRSTVIPEEEIITEGSPAAATRIQEHEPAVRNPSRFHRFAFSMVLVNAALDGLWLFVHGVALQIAGSAGSMAAFGGVIAALVVQTKKNTSAYLRKLTWITFVSYLALFAASYSVSIYYMVQSMVSGLSRNDDFNPFAFYTELVEKGPGDKPGLLAVVVISMGLSIVLGVMGLAAVNREKRVRGPVPGERAQE